MTEERPINPEVEFQAGLLAAKVARRVISLDEASAELSDWQARTLAGDVAERWRAVEPRALIVTHMINRLLKRGY
ncbi:hypothetical protein T8K17_03730 [Thalassobaculum sp. OXR-137]|uniref:hypothetical protein n=1 Tax=Thalassobaculum sp. OXR-137 TaxID=3100173 RepID=UPI002AC95934|nr:hypothetical protein [Thalassobaculum sp. OXR-137]WPZ35257.1 hypothetical protein T8K17_03730 [Thalassobaculum sp. OXR-137]